MYVITIIVVVDLLIIYFVVVLIRRPTIGCERRRKAYLEIKPPTKKAP